MKTKIVKLLTLTSIITLMGVGCSKKEEDLSQQEAPKVDVVENIENKENIIETIEKDTVYDNYSEFVKGSKNKVLEFSKWLSKYNIENEISKDGYSVENINKINEKNGINYDTRVYLSTEAHPSGDSEFYGKYNVELIYQNHVQEEYTKDNEFVKLVYDIVNGYGQDIKIDELAKELNDYVNKDIDTLSFTNDTVSISVYNQNTIKQLSMSFTNNIESIKLDAPVKEYSTMKEFIEASKELCNKIKEKASRITEDNIVDKDDKEIFYDGKNNIYMTTNFDGKLYQEVHIGLNIMRTGGSTIKFSNEAIETVYSILEDVYGEELQNYYSLEEFKMLVDTNITTKNDSFDDYNAIGNMDLILPYLQNGSIIIRNSLGDKDFIMEDIIAGYHYNEDELKAKLESFEDGVSSGGDMEIIIKIPVKAEGLTEYRPGENNGKYVLDDGTEFERIDSRY